jgi:hypothetical protein
MGVRLSKSWLGEVKRKSRWSDSAELVKWNSKASARLKESNCRSMQGMNTQ